MALEHFKGWKIPESLTHVHKYMKVCSYFDPGLVILFFGNLLSGSKLLINELLSMSVGGKKENFIFSEHMFLVYVRRLCFL